MSSKSMHNVICPKCGTKQSVERYDSINSYHEELFSKVVDKTIFDYNCQCCKEIIHAPYPLLFHRMGIQDIQIGYHMRPIAAPVNQMIAYMKNVLHDIGKESTDISECYNDEDEFANRISNFTK